jgi:hypothetical protein
MAGIPGKDEHAENAAGDPPARGAGRSFGLDAFPGPRPGRVAERGDRVAGLFGKLT